VTVTGNDGPDLRFSARPLGGGRAAIVGDVIKARGARFRARVLGGAGRQLLVVKDGQAVATVAVTGDDFTHSFAGKGSGRWRLQLMRGQLVDTVSSPIWVEPGRGHVQRARGGRGCRR
jgi:hypothetical protein